MCWCVLGFLEGLWKVVGIMVVKIVGSKEVVGNE